MTDYISREDALNFEMEIEADPEEIQAISKGMALYGEYIKSIPAAEVVKRKCGEWIVKSVGKTEYFQQEQYREITCSVCKNHVAWPSNYCPNCGADMRGDSKEWHDDFGEVVTGVTHWMPLPPPPKDGET